MSEESAIQKDVEQETETTQIIPDEGNEIDLDTKTSRDEIMNTVIERRKEEVQNEIDEEDFTETETFEEEISIESETDTDSSEKTVKIKVDGVESEVTEKEIREYQKQLAADKRLAEAAEKEKLLREREALIAAREEEIRRNAEAIETRLKPSQTTNESEDDLEDLADQLITSVFEEDKKATTEILKKLRPKNTPVQQIPVPKLNRSELNQAVVQAIDEQKRLAAVKRFEEKYSEFANRPGLRADVNERTKIEMQNDPDASWDDIIDRAVEHVKNDLAALSGVKSEDNKEKDVETEIKERRKKKSNLEKPVTTAAGGKSNMTVKPNIPALSVVEQMRKSRGQPI
jgi:hypothetical protein